MWQLRYILLFVCLFLSTLRAQSFRTRVLDWGSNGVTGLQTSQAVVQGNPAIAYYNDGDSSLMFARCNTSDGAGTWSITTVQYAGGVGHYPSLAVVDGKPAISYFDDTNGVYKYIRSLDQTGTVWGEPQTIDYYSAGGQYSSLVVINGYPAICYNGQSGYLKYIRALDPDGVNWNSPENITGSSTTAFSSCMAIVDGNPAVCFISNYGVLEYVRASDLNGVQWTEPVLVDVASTYTNNASLVVANGKPAIAYSSFTPGPNATYLKFVQAQDTDGATWNSPLVLDDSSQNVGFYASLAVVGGNPAISYYDLNNGDLKYIRARDPDGAVWGPRMAVDYTDDVGKFPSLAVINGNPAICYHDYTHGKLKYLTASDSTGGNWNAPFIVDHGFQSGDAGSYSAHFLINGNPSIAYYDQTNRSLKFIRSQDSMGTSWGEPVTICNSSDTGPGPTLAVINGNPAVVYSDPQGHVIYVRGADTNGLTWDQPIVVDSNGEAYTPSLIIANGNPAVAYYDQISRHLSFVRALDSNGSNWGSPTKIDNTDTAGYSCSALVVNGSPAVSYYDASSQSLKYSRALNANGSKWGTPLTLDPSAYISLQNSSIAIVDGRPAISYFDGNNRHLKYIRALNANGAIWGTPKTVIDVGFAGNQSSLAVIDGHPSICYFNNDVGSLEYVASSDPDGTNWGNPIFVDSTSINCASSLISVNGTAAISYYDYINYNLKWAILSPSDIAISEAGVPIETSLDFGSVAINRSATRTFTIANTGTSDLTSLSITGASGTDFTVSAPSSTAVPAGGSVMFTITFAPSYVGQSSASVAISGVVSGLTLTIDLSLVGSGIAPIETNSVPGSLRIKSIQDGKVSLDLHGMPGATWEVQRSTDLVNWSPMDTVYVMDANEIILLDPNPIEQSAFYRISTVEE